MICSRSHAVLRRLLCFAILFHYFLVSLTACVTPASSEPQTQVEAQPLSDESLAAITMATIKNGGVTYDMRRKIAVPIGRQAFAVSYAGGHVVSARIDNRSLEAAIKKFYDTHPELWTDPQLFLGTWRDDDRNEIAIDRTRLFDFTEENRSSVLKTALAFARAQGQKAIFDMQKADDIQVE